MWHNRVIVVTEAVQLDNLARIREMQLHALFARAAGSGDIGDLFDSMYNDFLAAICPWLADTRTKHDKIRTMIETYERIFGGKEKIAEDVDKIIAHWRSRRNARSARRTSKTRT